MPSIISSVFLLYFYTKYQVQNTSSSIYFCHVYIYWNVAALNKIYTFSVNFFILQIKVFLLKFIYKISKI